MSTKREIEILPNDVPLELLQVEGGTFAMGGEMTDQEQPIHEVAIPDFYMGKYPITNEQFLPFLQEAGNQEEGGRAWVNMGGQYEGARCGIEEEGGTFKCVPDLEHHPMIYVSWFGARTYCKWLSEKTGNRYRLPSELEWEYAVRGGKHSKGFQYSGSNKLKEVGWYNVNSHRETKAVGMKLPNELGLYDMSGNVWEWCADHWHNNYKDAPKDGRVWLEGGEENWRVVRGGSWNYLNDDCRVSLRTWDNDFNRYNDLGFRLSRY